MVPVWKSATFWPIVCPDGWYFAEFIINYMYFPEQEGLIVPGQSGQECFTNSAFLALRISFAHVI